jgi:hypothetical protein
MPMTRAEADEILAQRGGTTDVDGFLRFYEAQLLAWGWTDDEEREAEVQRERERLTSHRPQ